MGGVGGGGGGGEGLGFRSRGEDEILQNELMVEWMLELIHLEAACVSTQCTKSS